MDSKNTACHSDLKSDPIHFRQCGLVLHGMVWHGMHSAQCLCVQSQHFGEVTWYSGHTLLRVIHHLILNQLSDSACSETYHCQISHDFHTELCDPDEIMTHSLRNVVLKRAAR